MKKDGAPDTVSCQTCVLPVLIPYPCHQGAAQCSRLSLPLMVAVVQVNILRCLLDIASGLEFLHSMKVLHGDLKVGLLSAGCLSTLLLQEFCRSGMRAGSVFSHGCSA